MPVPSDVQNCISPKASFAVSDQPVPPTFLVSLIVSIGSLPFISSKELGLVVPIPTFPPLAFNNRLLLVNEPSSPTDCM